MFGSTPIGGGMDHGLTWPDRFFESARFEALPIAERDHLEDQWNGEPGAGPRRRAAHRRYLAQARKMGWYAVLGAFTDAEIAARFPRK